MPATDDFGGHEVLHTAYLVEDLFDRQLVEHAYVQANSTLKDAAVRVSDALHEFYQLVGRVTEAPSPTVQG